MTMTIHDLFEDYMDGVNRVLVERLSRPDGGSYPAPVIMLKSAFFAGAAAMVNQLDPDTARTAAAQRLFEELKTLSNSR
jgi:hypothetical protein